MLKIGRQSVIKGKTYLMTLNTVSFYSCLAPLKTLKIWSSAGNKASIDSEAPLVDPGNARTNVLSFTPATLLDNIENGVRSWP